MLGQTETSIETVTRTPDGRNQRSASSRRDMLAACREMMMDGIFQPAAANVAARAGVSIRTVFDHFGGVERLRSQAIDEDGSVRAMILRRVVGAEVAGTLDADVADRIVRAVVLGRA